VPDICPLYGLGWWWPRDWDQGCSSAANCAQRGEISEGVEEHLETEYVAVDL
jgi:hypothetical protein